MRRIFITLIALFTISNVNAQGWLDALKKVATEAVDKATDGALNKIAIVGSWSYSAPAVKLDGEDTLTSLSGSALSATLGTKLEGAFAKVGIVEGACSVTFNEDGTFTMPIKSRNITGTYTYNNEDHSLTMTLGQEKKVEVKVFAYIIGCFIMGLKTKELIGFWPTSTMFVILSVSLFYNFAAINGTLEKLSGTLLYACRKFFRKNSCRSRTPALNFHPGVVY